MPIKHESDFWDNEIQKIDGEETQKLMDIVSKGLLSLTNEAVQCARWEPLSLERLQEFQIFSKNLQILMNEIRLRSPHLSTQEKDQLILLIVNKMGSTIREKTTIQYMQICGFSNDKLSPDEKRNAIRMQLLHTASILVMLEICALCNTKLPYHNLTHTCDIALGTVRLCLHRNPSLALFAGMCHDLRMGFEEGNPYKRIPSMILENGCERMSFERAINILSRAEAQIRTLPKINDLFPNLMRLFETGDEKFLHDSIAKTVPKSVFEMVDGNMVFRTIENDIDAKEPGRSAVALADLGSSNRKGAFQNWLGEPPAVWAELSPFTYKPGDLVNMDRARELIEIVSKEEISEEDLKKLKSDVECYVFFIYDQQSFGEGRISKMQQYLENLKKEIQYLENLANDKKIFPNNDIKEELSLKLADLEAFQKEYCQEDGSIDNGGVEGIKALKAEYKTLLESDNHMAIAQDFVSRIKQRNGPELPDLEAQKKFIKDNHSGKSILYSSIEEYKKENSL
ncbi:MAG: hypothetical protein ACI9S8_002526 [Chlamydiales bacterium]|jgi:hypothetical protein